MPTQRERLNFLAETKPEKLEFNMTYIQNHKLKETFNKPFRLGGNGWFGSFTNNFYFDIVFKKSEERSVNQFYRRYIERRQLELQFDAYVTEVFGSQVETPIEQLKLKITAMYEELASSL